MSDETKYYRAMNRAVKSKDGNIVCTVQGTALPNPEVFAVIVADALNRRREAIGVWELIGLDNSDPSISKVTIENSATKETFAFTHKDGKEAERVAQMVADHWNEVLIL